MFFAHFHITMTMKIRFIGQPYSGLAFVTQAIIQIIVKDYGCQCQWYNLSDYCCEL